MPRFSDAEAKRLREIAWNELKNRRLMKDAWRCAGIPKRHQKRPKIDPQSPWVEKYAELISHLDSGFLIVLLGKRGTGKTQLAVELIRYHIEIAKDKRCLYTRAANIFMAIKEAYRRDGPGEQDQIQRFIEPRLLVIDEMNTRGDTAWEDTILTYIVDKRYGDTIDTLLISNQLRQNFRETIGESVYSRLIETGGIVECNWESFRGRKCKDG